MSTPKHIDRRSVLAGAAATASLTLSPAGALAQKARAPRAAPPTPRRSTTAAAAGKGRHFFTTREYRILDELAEMIIPADAHSGGARAAKVAEHLDRLIAESIDEETRQSWRDDLAEFDDISRNRYGKGFLELSDRQRVRILEGVSRREANPKEAGEYAFGTIKWAVCDIYYRTRIGIHDELQYKGNVLQDEFAGFDAKKG
jgi:hypothetical protein